MLMNMMVPLIGFAFLSTLHKLLIKWPVYERIFNKFDLKARNKVGDKVGFYKLSATGTLSKGKAYLESENAAPFLGFDGEDTTGINSVERGALSVEGCYTLDGRRVAQPTKGLYIVNGKKVIIK